MYNGKQVYVKEGDPNWWLLFAKNSMWMVMDTEDKNDNDSTGMCESDVRVDHPTLAKTWQVAVDGKFCDQTVETSSLVCPSSF